VVLTPRRWCQVRGVASAQPSLDKTYPRTTVAKQPGHRGARRKPLKPLRAGMPGDSGVLVVTRVRSTTTKCTRDRGCNGHPAFPTPSVFRGERFINDSGATRREVEGMSGWEERGNLDAVIPGWSQRVGALRGPMGTRPGISRFRVRCHRAALRADPLASPRNDGVWRARIRTTHWLAMTALQLKRLGCLKIESNNKPTRHART
jgi:hypothetical protein